MQIEIQLFWCSKVENILFCSFHTSYLFNQYLIAKKNEWYGKYLISKGVLCTRAKVGEYKEDESPM